MRNSCFLLEVEREIEEKYLRIPYSDVELTKLFYPQVKKVRDELLAIAEQELSTLEALKRDGIVDELSYYFGYTLIKYFVISQLVDVEAKISSVERSFAVATGRRKSNGSGITETEIQQAKSVPIERVASNIQFKKSGRNLVAICPFHEEKHPSFYVYSDSNSFYCFGCHRSGDVVNFIMFTHGFRFPEAVKFLIGGKI